MMMLFPEQTPNESNYKKTPRSPWVTKSLIKCIKKKNSLYYKYKYNPSPQTRVKYTKYKNFLTTLLRNEKKKYFDSQINTNRYDLNATWTVINRVLNKNTKKEEAH